MLRCGTVMTLRRPSHPSSPPESLEDVNSRTLIFLPLVMLSHILKCHKRKSISSFNFYSHRISALCYKHLSFCLLVCCVCSITEPWKSMSRGHHDHEQSRKQTIELIFVWSVCCSCHLIRNEAIHFILNCLMRIISLLYNKNEYGINYCFLIILKYYKISIKIAKLIKIFPVSLKL